MDFSKLFSLPYLLDKNPQGDFLWGFALLAFFVGLMFVQSIMKNFAKNDKHLRKSLRKKLWFYPFLGAIGIILVLSRFAGVPIFSMRIILFGLVLVTVGLMAFTFFRVKSQYCRRVKSAQREKAKKGA